MHRYVATAFLLVASAHASGIPLDSVNWEGDRLLITVSPQDVHGNDLPAQKLLLDTGSSTLAFCDDHTRTRDALAHEVAIFESKTFLGLGNTLGAAYSCQTYDGTGPNGRIGYWGRFYQGGLHVPNSDVYIKDAYFSVMQQQVGMPCNKKVQGVFGFGFRGNNHKYSEAPASWSSSKVGSCPARSGTLIPPLMNFLTGKSLIAAAKQVAKNLWTGHWHSVQAPSQIGIYWSGNTGTGEGQLYLDGDATNNPHYNADAASKIGKAVVSAHGFYDIGVLSTAIDRSGVLKSYPVGADCSVAGQCIMDSGTPSLVVPKAAYDDMMNSPKGTFTVTLAGHDFNPLQMVMNPLSLPIPASVKLEFDVAKLVNYGWLEPAEEDEIILGLPLRAFYYTVVDISDSTVSFSPMPAYHR